MLALTATAAPEVREEISRASECATRKYSCEASTGRIYLLRVDTFQTEDEKMSGLIRRIRFAEKPGIVYVATRKNAETIMGALQEEGVSARFITPA